MTNKASFVAPVAIYLRAPLGAEVAAAAAGVAAAGAAAAGVAVTGAAVAGAAVAGTAVASALGGVGKSASSPTVAITPSAFCSTSRA